MLVHGDVVLSGRAGELARDRQLLASGYLGSAALLTFTLLPEQLAVRHERRLVERDEPYEIELAPYARTVATAISAAARAG